MFYTNQIKNRNHIYTQKTLINALMKKGMSISEAIQLLNDIPKKSKVSSKIPLTDKETQLFKKAAKTKTDAEFMRVTGKKTSSNAYQAFGRLAKKYFRENPNLIS